LRVAARRHSLDIDELMVDDTRKLLKINARNFRKNVMRRTGWSKQRRRDTTPTTRRTSAPECQADRPGDRAPRRRWEKSATLGEVASFHLDVMFCLLRTGPDAPRPQIGSTVGG